jgi:hypothetical protein
MTENQTGRRRRSSSLLYQEPPETIEHMSDQAALPNLNADWVNAKGALTNIFHISKFDHCAIENPQLEDGQASTYFRHLFS